MTHGESAAGGGIPVSGAIDAHVHVMPERLLEAVRESLTAAVGWEFDHPTRREAIENVLRQHGIERYITLPYAHKPGIASDLNNWVCTQARQSDMCLPFATVHPADDVGQVVREAFENGACGLKFQCPVQEVSPEDPRLDPAYECCIEFDCPVLHHAGTAPMFEDSQHVGIERFTAFRERFPDVRACCAHMGTFEHEAFIEVARDDENVFLDTSFAMAEVPDSDLAFTPASIDDRVFEDLAGQILYGSDYPNLPHTYRQEYAGLVNRELSNEAQQSLFRGATEQFLGDGYTSRPKL